jgi:hypothetical protein
MWVMVEDDERKPQENLIVVRVGSHNLVVRIKL